jgi:acrylyl-CoA reductase (NADPH)
MRALLLTRLASGETTCDLRELPDAALPGAGDRPVTIAITHATVNYKDALALTGRAPIARQFPLVPGIDLAGRVVASEDERWRPGDLVFANGWGLGETHWGGLASRARVPGAWLQRVPAGFTAADVMAIGTAGYTAALCVLAIEAHGTRPDLGPVLVTGATGGVGSFATWLLAARGFAVTAATGKASADGYLRQLGASATVGRAPLNTPGKALQPEQWAAAVDTLGSLPLAHICATLRRGGIVTACGRAQGLDLPASVAPFILRGITLRGINSVDAPMPRREEAWSLLAGAIDPARLRSIAHTVAIEAAIPMAERLLAGEIIGRIVVTVT